MSEAVRLTPREARAKLRELGEAVPVRGNLTNKHRALLKRRGYEIIKTA